MSGPGHASGVAWAAQRRVAEPGGGAAPLVPLAREKPKGVQSFKNSSPRPVPCQTGAWGPRGRITPWTMRPGVPECWLGLGHGYWMAPELCPGCPVPDMAFYCN